MKLEQIERKRHRCYSHTTIWPETINHKPVVHLMSPELDETAAKRSCTTFIYIGAATHERAKSNDRHGTGIS